MTINYKNFVYYNVDVVVGDDEWKDIVLSSDPFLGDIGGGVNLTDKIVKTRKTLTLCSGCLSTCDKGTFNRVITEADEGQLIRNRFCELCCTAMGFEELCVGYESQKELSANLFIHDDEDESSEYIDDEPITLEDHIYSIRDKHEKVLVKQLGTRWFEKPIEVQYQVISGLYD